MDNMNFDANTINKLKDMMNKGELNDVISQIPPDMIKNFSSMMNSNNNSNINEQENHNSSNHSNSNNSNNSNNFDFNNLDINTILKMKSVMEKLNNKNDPRYNLLNSLKPYLRDEKKNKIDQYANLLNIAKITEIFNSNDKENNNNGI